MEPTASSGKTWSPPVTARPAPAPIGRLGLVIAFVFVLAGLGLGLQAALAMYVHLMPSALARGDAPAAEIVAATKDYGSTNGETICTIFRADQWAARRMVVTRHANVRDANTVRDLRLPPVPSDAILFPGSAARSLLDDASNERGAVAEILIGWPLPWLLVSRVYDEKTVASPFPWPSRQMVPRRTATQLDRWNLAGNAFMTGIAMALIGTALWMAVRALRAGRAR